MKRFVEDRWIAVAAALLVAAIAGGIGAIVAPRGPTTAAQAFVAMGLALAAGLIGGALARSRWIIVPFALVQLIAFELGRAGTVGPTVDEVRLDTPYGIIALVISRGLHGLLNLLPLTLGVLVGIAVGRRLIAAAEESPVSSSAGGRGIGTVLVGVATAALVVLVALPASTPPVLGADGAPVPGSISELTTVRLGGVDQAVMIRAASPDKPVLLYLSGGPGQSDIAFSRVFTSGWVNDFVFVDIEQRGNGKSYPAIDPVSSMTLERAVADVIDLTDYLRARFDEEKIYLMGESWGTILGVLAVQERPDLFYAWIGSGQMVDVVETDQKIYMDLVAHAERAGDAALAARLRDVGEPPYRDIPWANSNLLAWYEYLYKPYTPSEGYIARGEAAGLDPFGVIGSEYNFIEKTTVLRGLIDTFSLMYPQLYGLDLRERAPRLEVPVWMLDGAAELEGRRALALDWFERLEAPSKECVTYEGAAHSVAFEQADDVQRLLNEVIVPATYGR
ncbi:MAG TPA: alpha/beta fold hydrolase [Candidatus Limnocylindrales bacterium]|nr:alpha/beta fold hydrolase [Candidatus Limnocylindrales bacterium]